MSFFSDLSHGNFGNLWHDVESQVVDHPLETLGYAGAAAGTALTAGALGPELFGGVAAAEGGAAAGEGVAAGGGWFSSLFGGGAEAAGSGDEALGFAAPSAPLGISSGNAAIDSAFGGGAGGLSGGVTGAESAATGAGAANPLAGSFDAALQGPASEAGLSADVQSAAQFKEGGSGFLGKLGTGAMNSITNNPLGTAAAGAGLGISLLRGNPTDPKQKQIEATAGQLGAQGKILTDYLANGTLPPALQAQLTQATAAAKARITANHAKNGMSTDPSQNSALAQELNAVDLNAVSSMAQSQMDMMKTGLNTTGLSTQLYETLVKMDKQNNTDLMNAIASFASALGGGGKQTIQLKAA